MPVTAGGTQTQPLKDARASMQLVPTQSKELAKPVSSRRSMARNLRGDYLTYSSLIGFWRRRYRNGNWAKLSTTERGVFRCGLWVARMRGKISNIRLMVQVLRIALKLLETQRSRIVNAGRRRAMQMLEAYAKPGGLFTWAPHMREWLYDPRYVLYLGVMEMTP